MSSLTKIFKATPDRKTRLHDLKGNFVDRLGLLNIPLAITTGVLLKAVGYRPRIPWISFQATRVIRRLSRPDWKILEFGSGMSTLWFARHCGSLHSIESDAHWHERMSRIIAQEKLSHVKYGFRSPDQYADFSEYPDHFFDFIMVDGVERDACVQNGESKVKPGGYLYLDNCDQEPVAEGLLLDAIERRGGTVTYFTDFVPTGFHVTQGILARFSSECRHG